ncbi:NAD(P)/FAD-dependent oxidoreductase [Saccharopolyspora cebuensis]|uniref:NAD(P)/FAD-dependent oxidoreductase n=1 Tax=Saccharopolyspora cebuensis TaxID=418759 RepID=A0ABV4CGM8_9PSEU
MTGTIGVIGAGVSGLTAAHLLATRHDVVLFEADDRLGGHAHTHDLTAEDGRPVPVDTGFLVHNERTYPNLLRLFAELGVTTRDTEMSMSVRCEGCGLEYAGARKLAGLFPTAATARNGRYLRMLAQVPRFHREANRLLDDPAADPGTTLGEFLARGGHSRYFTEHFALPLVSAVWSTERGLAERYPARYLFHFLRNHGMLSVGGSPAWRTVVGGSGEYVRRIAERLPAVRSSTPVRSVHPRADGVDVRDHADVVHRVDRVVLATHADQALGLLAEPTERQRRVLGAFGYSDNETLLHTDPGPLPDHARASWNYLKPGCAGGSGAVRVSYDLNRLMRLAEPVDYVVTLNGADRVAPDRVLAKMQYRHPVYTPESVAAQRDLPGIGDERVRFAGAYHGWGFHEDGCASGVRAAEAMGVRW